MGWADIWALDRSRIGPCPVLALSGFWDLVCNILSLMLSTYYALSFEVGSLGHYVVLLDWLYT